MVELKNRNRERRGVTILEFRGHWGVEHFGMLEGKGELKCSCHPW